MKIAVLAWGSLIWEPRNLQTTIDFLPFGPKLPVEFSRVSGGKRLTLVIDEANGFTCCTFLAKSIFTDLDPAKHNLKEREGMAGVKGVGSVDLTTGTESQRSKERHPIAVETIRLWAMGTGHDAVIWPP